MMQTPIRVLHVVGAMNRGGAETMIMNLYRAIDRDTVQFDFVTHSGSVGSYDEEIKSLGGKKYICPHYNGFNHVVYVKWWKNFFDGHAEYKILHSHIRSVASIYLPIAQKNGLTTIAHSHSTSNGSGFRAFVKNILQIPIRYQADYLFACSQEAGEWLFGKSSTRGDRFRVIPNSINPEHYKYNLQTRNFIRNKFNIDDKFVIGHVGSFRKVKNHTFLLKCFKEFFTVNKKNKEAILLLIGNGDLLEKIKEEAEKLGISNAVLFLGEQHDVATFYQAMDCFVFPSLWEGLGMSVVEAQAAGLHCIVSSNVPRSVDIGAGLVEFLSLKNEAPKYWRQRIERIKNVNKMDRIDTSSFLRKKGYDVYTSAMKLKNFYQEIIGKELSKKK